MRLHGTGERQAGRRGAPSPSGMGRTLKIRLDGYWLFPLCQPQASCRILFPTWVQLGFRKPEGL